jgi:hypothetical protein
VAGPGQPVESHPLPPVFRAPGGACLGGLAAKHVPWGVAPRASRVGGPATSFSKSAGRDPEAHGIFRRNHVARTGVSELPLAPRCRSFRPPANSLTTRTTGSMDRSIDPTSASTRRSAECHFCTQWWCEGEPITVRTSVCGTNWQFGEPGYRLLPPDDAYPYSAPMASSPLAMGGAGRRHA